MNIEVHVFFKLWFPLCICPGMGLLESPDTSKLLEENLGRILFDINDSKIFLE